MSVSFGADVTSRIVLFLLVILISSGAAFPNDALRPSEVKEKERHSRGLFEWFFGPSVKKIDKEDPNIPLQSTELPFIHRQVTHFTRTKLQTLDPSQDTSNPSTERTVVDTYKLDFNITDTNNNETTTTLSHSRPRVVKAMPRGVRSPSARKLREMQITDMQHAIGSEIDESAVDLQSNPEEINLKQELKTIDQFEKNLTSLPFRQKREASTSKFRQLNIPYGQGFGGQGFGGGGVNQGIYNTLAKRQLLLSPIDQQMLAMQQQQGLVTAAMLQRLNRYFDDYYDDDSDEYDSNEYFDNYNRRSGYRPSPYGFRQGGLPPPTLPNHPFGIGRRSLSVDDSTPEGNSKKRSAKEPKSDGDSFLGPISKTGRWATIEDYDLSSGFNKQIQRKRGQSSRSDLPVKAENRKGGGQDVGQSESRGRTGLAKRKPDVDNSPFKESGSASPAKAKQSPVGLQKIRSESKRKSSTGKVKPSKVIVKQDPTTTDTPVEGVTDTLPPGTVDPSESVTTTVSQTEPPTSINTESPSLPAETATSSSPLSTDTPSIPAETESPIEDTTTPSFQTTIPDNEVTTPPPQVSSDPTVTTDPVQETTQQLSTTTKPTVRPPFNQNLVCRCGTQSVRGIDIGEETVIRTGVNPWIVAVRSRRKHLCSGSIINNKYILTAKHCVRGMKEIIITAGLGSGLPKNFSVTRVKEHRFKNIALLKVKPSISPNFAMRPVCLPITQSTRKQSGPKTGTLVTFRKTSPKRASGLHLMQTEVPMLSEEKCRTAVGPGASSSSLFCASPPATMHCGGDSGGVLQTHHSGYSFAQIGVVSTTVGCRASKKPGIYTDIRKSVNWVLYNTKDAQYCHKPEIPSEGLVYAERSAEVESLSDDVDDRDFLWTHEDEEEEDEMD